MNLNDGGRESVFECLQARFLNCTGNILRRALGGVGPPLRMHKKLARELVARGDYFMLSLNSGMQTPILDAINYLAEISDHASVPELKKLFEKNVPENSGPDHYTHPFVRRAAAEALLKLLPLSGAKELVKEAFVKFGMRSWDRETLEILVAFAVDNDVREISAHLLELGKFYRFRFECQYRVFQEDLQTGNRASLSHCDLYMYEDLIYAVYKLSSDSKKKEEALQILIEEYNHPDVDLKFGNRCHDNINSILCKIIRDLAGNQAEQSRIISLINPRRFEKDKEYYKLVINLDNN